MRSDDGALGDDPMTGPASSPPAGSRPGGGPEPGGPEVRGPTVGAPELEPLPVKRPWWRRPGGLLLAGVVVASFLFWIYALSGLAKRDPPDSLQRPDFAERAEPRCATTAAAVAELPPAQTARDPAERADTVDAGTRLLRAM